MFLISSFLAGSTEFFFKQDVSRFLALYIGVLLNRAADYKKNNDNERADACEGLKNDLLIIFELYLNTGVKVPTPKQIKNNPAGDNIYLLNLYS